MKKIGLLLMPFLLVGCMNNETTEKRNTEEIITIREVEDIKPVEQEEGVDVYMGSEEESSLTAVFEEVSVDELDSSVRTEINRYKKEKGYIVLNQYNTPLQQEISYLLISVGSKSDAKLILHSVKKGEDEFVVSVSEGVENEEGQGFIVLKFDGEGHFFRVANLQGAVYRPIQ